MWNKKDRRGSFVRDLSISEWNGAPTEEISTYDASNTDGSGGSGAEMNIDSIYDAIKTGGTKDDDVSSKGHLFDSTRVNPDLEDLRQRKPTIIGAYPGNAFKKKLTRRTSETSLTVPSSNSNSMYAPTTSNIWTRLLGGNDELWDKGDVYDEADDDSEFLGQDTSTCDHIKACSRFSYLESRHFFTTLGRYPYIIVASFLVFVLVLGAGMGIIQSERSKHIQQMKGTAEFMARDAAIWFADEFRRAMMPLYGIQQGVIHSGYFDTLNDEIGRYPQHVIEDTIGTPMTKRNVTGICDDKNLQAKFRSIVEPVNAENNLDGIVVGYRLFPNNVACLSEPSDESTRHFKLEDFPQGNEKGSAEMTWGFDAGNSDNPFWNMVTEELFIKQQLSIFGPFSLPPLKETFCGHLAIWTEFDPENPFQNVLNLHGSEVAGAWGFVMNFLDWSKMLDRSDIYQRFASRGLEFELYRVSGALMEGVDRATLAKSTHSHLLTTDNSVTVKTESLHGTWGNRVGRVEGWEPSWYPMAVGIVVLLSLIFAFLTASMLVERQLHRDLLYKVMPKRAIKKLQRGQTVLEKFNLVTIFFSDIVGYTSMASKMRPLQVMAMLNELYTEFDKLVEKHKVYKVETIGDAFMVVGGAPDRVAAPLAAERVALFALDAVNFVKDFRTKHGDQIFIRAGLASGPVCAGVVGNAMPRYCFFGDTVNFASRMESTSIRMKIQVSELTYRLLQDSPNMIFELDQRREGENIGIEVKGKGHQITYWVKKANKRGSLVIPVHDDIEAQSNLIKRMDRDAISEASSTEEREDIDLLTPEETYDTYVLNEDWAVTGQSNVLADAQRDKDTIISCFVALLEHHLQCVLEERQPGFKLSLSVKVQLTKFITAIAETYGNPHFHCLSHALHVTSSMNKVLSESLKETSALENFSLIFAAFLHDAGHTGMNNKMLQDEAHILSQKYSPDIPIAERFSIEIACEVLLQEQYSALCDAIMPDDISRLKFSKALFQSILVTDIANPSHVKQCIQRYQAACNGECCTPDLCPLAPHLSGIMAQFFKGSEDIKRAYPDEFRITTEGLQECVRREHFMLISDVSHLFQCWENFVKWNFRLYKEIHNNFSKGLCSDPSEGWFEGQIGFLEKYAIPLAIRSEIFLNQEFSHNLINLGRANLALWINGGVEASSIMADGVTNCENEDTVLQKLYAIHKP